MNKIEIAKSLIREEILKGLLGGKGRPLLKQEERRGARQLESERPFSTPAPFKHASSAGLPREDRKSDYKANRKEYGKLSKITNAAGEAHGKLTQEGFNPQARKQFNKISDLRNKVISKLSNRRLKTRSRYE